MIGLFRALGVDAPGRCRATRPLYRPARRRCSSAASRAATCRRRAAAAGARSRARRSTSAARRSSAPIASSRRAGSCAATSAAARSSRRGPTRPARRLRGAARSSAAALQATDTTVRDLVRAAGRSEAHFVCRRRAGARLLSRPRRFSSAIDACCRDAGRCGVASTGRPKGMPRFRAALAHRFGGEPEQHPGPRRRAAGARSAGALPDRSRRRGHHRSARLSRRDAHVPQRRRAAGRLGHYARRPRRARRICCCATGRS